MQESEDIEKVLNKRCDTRQQQIYIRGNAKRAIKLWDGWT